MGEPISNLFHDRGRQCRDRECFHCPDQDCTDRCPRKGVKLKREAAPKTPRISKSKPAKEPATEVEHWKHEDRLFGEAKEKKAYKFLSEHVCVFWNIALVNKRPEFLPPVAGGNGGKNGTRTPVHTYRKLMGANKDVMHCTCKAYGSIQPQYCLHTALFKRLCAYNSVAPPVFPHERLSESIRQLPARCWEEAECRSLWVSMPKGGKVDDNMDRCFVSCDWSFEAATFKCYSQYCTTRACEHVKRMPEWAAAAKKADKEREQAQKRQKTMPESSTTPSPLPSPVPLPPATTKACTACTLLEFEAPCTHFGTLSIVDVPCLYRAQSPLSTVPVATQRGICKGNVVDYWQNVAGTTFAPPRPVGVAPCGNGWKMRKHKAKLHMQGMTCMVDVVMWECERGAYCPRSNGAACTCRTGDEKNKKCKCVKTGCIVAYDGNQDGVFNFSKDTMFSHVVMIDEVLSTFYAGSSRQVSLLVFPLYLGASCFLCVILTVDYLFSIAVLL